MNEDLSLEIVKELFDYSPDTGLLTWRVGGSPRKIGKVVGGRLDVHGYRVCCVNYRAYKQHRVVWLWWYGKWPVDQIDHVNGDRSDNRIANLRQATNALNAQNKRTCQTNNTTTGLLGACLDRKAGKYKASIGTERKQVWLGYFDTKEEAHEAYLDAKRRLHAGNTL